MRGTPFMVLAAAGAAQAATAQDTAIPPIFTAMAGEWSVRSRTWGGSDARPEEQPPASASRSVPAGGGFLEERITGEAQGKPFTRVASLGFNAPEHVFEYASLDARAPQLMHYRTSATSSAAEGSLQLSGASFVVARWGKWQNTRFGYRLEVGPVVDDHQTVKIFFQPQTKPAAPEFLGTQYDYVRKP